MRYKRNRIALSIVVTTSAVVFSNVAHSGLIKKAVVQDAEQFSIDNNLQLASNVFLKALQFMDVNYKYGGVSPTGFDCSGFIQYIFRTAVDAQLPRTSAEQAGYGIPVKREELQVGDIVFFNTIGKRKNSHNGIYIGNDKFIHAPRSGKRVHIADMNKDYWSKRFNGARRVTVEYVASKQNIKIGADSKVTVHKNIKLDLKRERRDRASKHIEASAPARLIGPLG